jgi:hypothetical protein
MANPTARHLVKVLMESPLYLGLTLKERRRLIAEFTAIYTLSSDNRPDSAPTDEPAAKAR